LTNLEAITKGYEVHKPSLTGLGERELLTKAISLTTNIIDITNYLKWYDLRGVVLVGHSYSDSYGGSVIFGVA
jgi:hypothetical protein